jgi:hypothetical protein
MTGSVPNGEGFHDTREHFYIKETIREHKLEFLAVMATGRSNFRLPNLAGGFDYQWYRLFPPGGWGILLGITTGLLHVQKTRIFSQISENMQI